MLSSLQISNMAIIASVSLDFESGFTVLTGETGAGKTVLLSSLGMLQGEPTSDTMIREGADRAMVEAHFTQLSIEIGEEHFTDITVSRELIRNKPSICRLNGHRVPIKTLKSLKAQLFHSVKQHEGLSLSTQSYQRALLDHYGKKSIAPLKETYQQHYTTYRTCYDALSQLNTAEQDQDQQLEFLNFQIDDISKQNFEPNEEETLKQQKTALKSQQKLTKLSQESVHSLSEVTTHLTLAEKAINALSAIDDSITPLQSQLLPIQVTCQDIHATLQQKQQDWKHLAGGDINTIETRLDTIFRYKSKYKVQTLPQLIDRLDTLKQKRKDITTFSDKKEQLTQQLEQERIIVSQHGLALFQERQSVAIQLSKAIETDLSQLNFQSPKVQLDLTYTPDQLSADGQDKLTFLIAPNIGFSPLPLDKIASGGERSRILLVLQSILQDQNQTDTLIFDEIDTGVGGMTAHTLAEKLKSIAQKKQVITITHLPQIAEKADHHFCIQKGIQAQKTTTTIHLLATETDRKEEFQRMSGQATIV